MLHRHRRLAVGVVLLAIAAIAGLVVVSAAAANSGDVAVGAARSSTPINATIRADGTSAGLDPEWFVSKGDVGEYKLSFGRDVRFVLESWDGTATATLLPTSTGTWVVEFVHGDDPVNTGFTFSAVPIEP